MRVVGRWSAVATVVSLAVFAACGGTDNGTNPGGNGTPAIAIALSASTLSLQQGTSSAVTVTLTRSGGFTGDVSVSVEGLPTGVTAPSATIAAGSTTATLNLSAAATAAAATSNLTIRATGSGVTAVTSALALTTTAAATPTIAIALSASTLSVAAGASGSVTVTLTRSGGFTGDVTVVVEGLPTGVTAPNATIATGATTATLNLSAAATAAAATTNLTVRATGTGVTSATSALALTTTAAAAGSFSLSASPTTVTLAQGASTTVTLNIARTGTFAGAVGLTLSGVPAGLTATLGAASVTGASTTLTLTASATLAAGAQTIVVTGTGTGVSNATVSVPVTITVASGSTGSIAYNFCARTGIPIWVAVQDGTGAFTRVTGTNDVYSFNLTQGRGGVAYVLPVASGGFDLEVFYGSTAEITTNGTQQCNSQSGPGKTVTATVAGNASTDNAQLALGTSLATVTNGTAASFAGVQNGNVDLIAAHNAFAFNGSAVSFNLDKIIIRRNLSPAAGSALAAIDFNGTEAFVPVSRNVTINNLNGETGLSTVSYITANNPFPQPINVDIGGSSTAARIYKGVPTDRQATGDLHLLNVIALQSLATLTQTRQGLLSFKDAADKVITLGPAITAPVVSALTATGYGRVRCAITVQAEYNKYFTCDAQSTATGALYRKTTITQAPSYSTASSLNLDTPDLSAVSGFDTNWGLKVGTATTWTVTVTGYTNPAGTTLPLFSEGFLILSATKQGNVTP